MTAHIPAILVENLGKRFGTRVAVEGLSFEIPKGEIFGLLGPNGAGKTTTVRMLTGLLKPTEGKGKVLGIDLPLASGSDGVDLRRKVGLLTEQPGLYERLTARENLEFFIRLNELHVGSAWERVHYYLGLFGLAQREDDPVGSYSKGMRQKLAIVRTLLHAPDIVFLDEPTSGLDPESTAVVREAFVRLAKEGTTLILCSHNLYEVERLCSRVAVIKNRQVAVHDMGLLKTQKFEVEVVFQGLAEPWVNSVLALGFKVTMNQDKVLRVEVENHEKTGELITHLVMRGACVQQVVPKPQTLEQVYLQWVAEELQQ